MSVSIGARTGALASFLLVGACMAGQDTGNKIELGTGTPAGTSGPDIDITSHFQVTKLTADQPGVAKFTEPPLVDVWGVTSLDERFWAAAQDKGQLIGLEPDGKPTGIRIQLDPVDPSKKLVAGLTGITLNESDRIQMDIQGKCDRVKMIVASETGRLWGVNPDLSKTNGAVLFSNPKAQYTGVALIPQSGTKNQQLVLAVDFHGGHIDVLNDHFHPVGSPKFAMPKLPDGLSPFGIMALEDRVIVTVAQRRAPVDGEVFDQQVAGDGKGMVLAFDLNGKLIWSTKSDMFNVPWGLAMGELNLCATGALLVGQHGRSDKLDGDGNKFGGAIIAMDPKTGKVISALQDGDKQPVRVQGLWGLTFGTNITNIDQELLHMGAGPQEPRVDGKPVVAHGLFARLDPQDP